ncbi:MAG: hypothetical protein H6828_14460 [Planctomycetes bacterium]|nr:hypothetical protein [Planctomycetota bacterium]
MLVDALLGTGFRGALREPAAGLLAALGAWAARARAPVAALDLPSGLDADAGTPAPGTPRCAVTLTFVAPKVGFASEAARAVLGEVEVVPIGLPPRVAVRVL